MKALVLLIPFILIGVIFVFGLARTKPKLPAEERKELLQLRAMRDDLIHLSLERIEVEPFAVVVLDTIRNPRSIK